MALLTKFEEDVKKKYLIEGMSLEDVSRELHCNSARITQACKTIRRKEKGENSVENS